MNYLLLLLAICGGIMAGLLASNAVNLSLGSADLLMPEPTVQQDRVRQLQESDFQVILNRDLFDSQAAGKPAEHVDLSLAKIPTKEQQQPGAKPVGNMKLIGTVVAGKDSLAVIQVGTKVGIYKLKAELAPGVVLVEVARNRAVVSEQGTTRELVIKEGKPGKQQQAKLIRRTSGASGDGIVQIDASHWQISKSAAANARNNFNRLLSTARMVPQVKNGQTIGFRLLEMVRGSLLQKIGLHVGDILVEINHVVLDSPEKALQVFQQVREANNISLGLIRNGERKTFEYNFE